jgi:hypothetical protein
MFTDADLIHAYSRAQALEDGQLVDVTDNARQVGIKVPVAVTAAVFGLCIEVPPSRRRLEDVGGRTHDIVWLLRCAIRRSGGGRRVDFVVSCSTRAGRRNVRLKALCGPGDAGEPVITVMCHDES